MTEKEYRSHPAVSRSELWRLYSESPEKFRFYKDEPPPATDALIFGQALHMSVLQPDIYADNFAVMPDVDRRTREGKAAWAAFTAENEGKTAISADWQAKIDKMTAKLNGDPYVRKLLSGEHEKPYFWTDELTGEECKCRVDSITQIGGVNYIIDVKTAEDASGNKFMKKSIDFGYPMQAAMYSEGVKKASGTDCRFVFVIIEKSPPYAVNIMQADGLYTQYGYDMFREAIGIYHDCKINNNWYGYLGKFNNINVLGLPAYLAKEFE